MVGFTLLTSYRFIKPPCVRVSLAASAQAESKCGCAELLKAGGSSGTCTSRRALGSYLAEFVNVQSSETALPVCKVSKYRPLKMSNKETTEVSENKPQLKFFLPKELLECVPRCGLLPKERLRWNTNEEIASYLITFEKHEEWLSCSPKTR
ncbi:calmodulin-binding transcription activator 1-like [Microcaecilia unicolor]|uniref:Calmodulin-binding transcription activator 1-like n=1 Tax=Microcaecilia unicolor TaxID=1415580 RepID=A0A6P7WKX1_9AMPH|nr:calmodulin-binding transcription activator 1-like [Microcaecilia unicolor]